MGLLSLTKILPLCVGCNLQSINIFFQNASNAHGVINTAQLSFSQHGFDNSALLLYSFLFVFPSLLRKALRVIESERRFKYL